MEWCLGVKDHVLRSRRVEVEGDSSRYDVTEADALMEAESNDPARLRYQKMFWEAVPDGQVCCTFVCALAVSSFSHCIR